MPYPQQLSRYFRMQISETDGPDPSLDGITNGDITEEVSSYTVPTVALASEEHNINGGKGSAPVPFGVEELTFALEMKGILSCIVGLLHTRPTFILTEYLYSLDDDDAATEDTLTYTMKGLATSLAPGQVSNQAGQRPAAMMGVTIRCEVVKKQHSNAAEAAVDINTRTNTYNFNGVPMFAET